MQRFCSTVILLGFILSCHSPQPNKTAGNGIYSGVFSHGNFTDQIHIEITSDTTGFKVFFTSLEQNAFQIPSRKVMAAGDSINFVVQSDLFKYVFRNKWNEDRTQLYGTLEVDTLFVPYTLKKEGSVHDSNQKTREVVFKSNGLELGGTIWFPSNSNNKALIFITSSGNADRSGSRAEASYFAKRGYTTFHYDKRGTGLSEGNWQTADMEELCSDDINAISYFSGLTGIPLSETAVKGSSQGAAKVPFILTNLKDIKLGVVVSCPGSTLLESDLNYWKNQNRQALGDQLESASQLERQVFRHIAGDLTRNELEKTIYAEKLKPWFSEVWIPDLDSVQTDTKLLYNPIPYFENTKQPILLIQGMADQIIPENSYEIISRALDSANNNMYDVVLLENANHAMLYKGQSDFPYWSKLHDDYLPAIENWLNANFQ